MPNENCCIPEVGNNKGIYEVIITKAENGFIVRVGCKTFVFNEWSQVAAGLEEYYKDPIAARKKFCGE